MINRENLSKSLVSSKSLKKGHILTKDDILVRSPGQGLSPQRYDELLGRKLNRDMNEEDYFFQSDIDGIIIKPKDYKFSRPWGVPVRHHDFEEYNSIINCTTNVAKIQISRIVRGIISDYRRSLHLATRSRRVDLTW